jgi:plastocyanin domain-containing protein
VQEVDVTVRGGYSPDRIEVAAGRPVRLTFVREEESPCTAELVFPGLGLVKDLPVGRPVTVEFTPEGPGEYPFHCGMNMVRGKVVVTGTGRPEVPTHEPAAAAHH